MAVEQVFSDRDSEDEVDDDIADFEDRRVRYDNVFAQKHIAYVWCCQHLSSSQSLSNNLFQSVSF